MRAPTALFLSLLTLGAFAVVGWQGCKPDSDEQQLQEMVVDGARLAAAHDVGGILEYALPTFEAKPAGIGRPETQFLLQRVFRRFGRFEVLHPTPKIDVDAAAGKAHLKVPFIILRADQEPPALSELTRDPVEWFVKAREVADPYALELELVKRDGSWLVRTARVDGTRSAASF